MIGSSKHAALQDPSNRERIREVILGLSHETVIQHLKEARERYGVPKRTLLAVHALFDGTIAFFDVLRR